MEYKIKNEYLTVSISSLGAELQSIQDKQGKEYLWQGDPEIWAQRAPVLFPYIGRMTEGSYRYRGKKYMMGLHGFAAEAEFTCVPVSRQEMVFFIQDSEETRERYPFLFRFGVRYRLEGTCIHVAFEVENMGAETMYFGVGGHPGFWVPMEEGLRFEDYSIQFDQGITPVKLQISDANLVLPGGKELALDDSNSVALTHRLFDQDTMILREAGYRVRLYSPKGTRSVEVSFPKMAYLGIWQMERKSAPFVCIEPWSSLPSRQGVIEDLETQENLERLEPGGNYENSWSIRLIYEQSKTGKE